MRVRRSARAGPGARARLSRDITEEPQKVKIIIEVVLLGVGVVRSRICPIRYMEAASLVKHEGYSHSRQRIRANSTEFSFSGLETLPDQGEWEAEHHFEMLMLDG